MSAVASQLHAALLTLEGDGTLTRRFRATQELKLLLEEIPDNSAMPCKVCTGRGVASLVVALMDECGEDRHATRNDILACLASLVRFVPGSELSSDGRLWALLMRMLYQRDEASVYHALRAMSHLGAKPESLQTLRAARRMPAIMTELARSPHQNVAAAALQVSALIPSTAEAAAAAAAEKSRAAAPPYPSDEKPVGRRSRKNTRELQNRELQSTESSADTTQKEAVTSRLRRRRAGTSEAAEEEDVQRESMIADLRTWRASMGTRLTGGLSSRGTSGTSTPLVGRSGTTTPGYDERDERGGAEYDEREREREAAAAVGRARRASKDFTRGIPLPRFLGSRGRAATDGLREYTAPAGINQPRAAVVEEDIAEAASESEAESLADFEQAQARARSEAETEASVEWSGTGASAREAGECFSESGDEYDSFEFDSAVDDSQRDESGELAATCEEVQHVFSPSPHTLTPRDTQCFLTYPYTPVHTRTHPYTPVHTLRRPTSSTTPSTHRPPGPPPQASPSRPPPPPPPGSQWPRCARRTSRAR
jgi:hypothetical protein